MRFWTLAVVTATIQQPLKFDTNNRLIDLGNGNVQRMTLQEVLALKRAGVGLMDITEHPDEPNIESQKQHPKYPSKLTQQSIFDLLSPELAKHNLESTLTNFTSFFTRYAKSQYGLDSCLWLYEQVQKFASDQKQVTVELFDHNWLQKSIIARIPGKKSPENVIIVGSHQDSINLVHPDLLGAPGADDDGSGTVTILEVFRVLLASGYQPKNTVEFHWYSAEELGLLGSQDIFSNYSQTRVDVRAMLQQDMTGYSDGNLAKGKDAVALMTDFVSPPLVEFMKLIIESYSSLEWVEGECGYGCSDHASATKYGYPSAFVFESLLEDANPSIHTTRDTLDRLDFDHMLQHARLSLGYVLELGDVSF